MLLYCIKGLPIKLQQMLFIITYLYFFQKNGQANFFNGLLFRIAKSTLNHKKGNFCRKFWKEQTSRVKCGLFMGGSYKIQYHRRAQIFFLPPLSSNQRSKKCLQIKDFSRTDGLRYLRSLFAAFLSAVSLTRGQK